MMSRPTYETEADMTAEDKAIQTYTLLLNREEGLESGTIKHHKTKKYTSYDYMLHRNVCGSMRCVSIVEIKVRTTAREVYPTYMISLSKVLEMLKDSELLDVPAVLCVRWTDSIGWLNLNREMLAKLSINSEKGHSYYKDTLREAHLGVGGRTDRGDLEDTEMCLYIGIEHFEHHEV